MLHVKRRRGGALDDSDLFRQVHAGHTLSTQHEHALDAAAQDGKALNSPAE